jgi:hypothetical protein
MIVLYGNSEREGEKSAETRGVRKEKSGAGIWSRQTTYILDSGSVTPLEEMPVRAAVSLWSVKYFSLSYSS